MQYREVGDTGITVSALGIGTMRFKDKDNAAEMIHRELELGLTYFDVGSAYSYKAFDENAEAWVGAAIESVPREQMVLSAKAQPRSGEAQTDKGLGVNTRDDMWKCMENSMKRVGVDGFDFYQLWDMSAQDHFEAGCEGDDSPLQAMREAKEQGLVRELGFTSHAQADEIVQWLEAVPDFRFVTIYYNFNDRAPEKVIEYARENGVGVCIMGPLMGGLLTGQSEAFGRALPEMAGAPVQEIALRFLLANPGISTVISGMNEIAHLEENANVADLAEEMTAEQRERFIEAFGEFSKGEDLCTGCRYCQGVCPEGLPVWQMMAGYQLAAIFEIASAKERIKASHGNERVDPNKCTACGACVERCPQNLPIPERMEKLAALMDDLHATAEGE